jgi:hypothetical protein
VPESIRFEWSRAFAIRPGAPAYAFKNGKILQVGERRQTFSPLRLGEVHPLYLEFAQLDGSPDACVAFAEKYGLLCEPAKLTKPPSEELSFWKAEIRRMLVSARMLPTRIRTVNSRGTFAKVGNVDVLLVPGAGADALPRMVMEPSNLLQAMNLEMAHRISGGARLAQCRNCGILFQSGAGGKRAVAQFHSNECRIAFHNAKRGSK